MTLPTRRSTEPDGNIDAGGAPTDLDRLIQVGDRRITVAERIVELRGMGATQRRAANGAGVRFETINRWLADAGKAQVRLAAYYGGTPEGGLDPDGILSDFERKAILFGQQEEDAWARYIRGLHGSALRLATGGILVERTVEKYDGLDEKGQPKLVETQTTRSHTLPDLAAIQFLLKAAAPEEFGNRLEVEHRLATAGSGELLSLAAEAFDESLKARARDAIEANGRDGLPPE